MNRHVKFGVFTNAVDNFERSAARAVEELRIAERAAAAVPGIELPAELREKIAAFHGAASTGLAAFASAVAPLQLKGIAA